MSTPSEAAAGETAERRDPHPWRATILLTLVVVAIGMAWSLWLDPVRHHTRYWLAPFDAWAPIPSAQYVANGALPYLYEGTRLYVAPPLFAIVLAPIAFIGQTFGLTWSTITTPIEHPTLWLVYGPFGLALCFCPFRAARTFALIRDDHRVVRVQLAALVLVAVPAAVIWGHYEDVLALAAVIAYATRRMRGRHGAAALWLSVAIGFKQWALLAVPVAVATTPKGQRVRTTILSLALPVALVALPLAADWQNAAPALFDAGTDPWLGHPALWIIHPNAGLAGTPSRLGAVAFALAVAWLIRRRDDERTLLAGLEIVFLGRLLFEPTLFPYYLVPGLLMAVLHERETTGRIIRSTILGLIALCLFLVPLQRDLWWIVDASIWVALAWPAARDVLRRGEPATVAADATPETAAALVAP